MAEIHHICASLLHKFPKFSDRHKHLLPLHGLFTGFKTAEFGTISFTSQLLMLGMNLIGASPLDINLKELALSGDFVAIDVEGDGHKQSRPVAFAAIHFRGGVPFRHYCTLINPGRPIDPYVSREIHGITDDMVSTAPDISEIVKVLPSVAPASIPWIGHNIASDIEMLCNATPDFPIPELMFENIRLFKWAFPGLKKSNLMAVAEAVKLRTNGDSDHSRRHDPLEDALIAGESFVRMARMIPENRKIEKHVSNMSWFRIPNRLQRRLDATSQSMPEAGPKR